MRSYDAAVIGLGNIGARFHDPNGVHPFNHTEALLRHERTNLIGGVDPSPEHRTYFERTYGLPSYAELEELLDRKPAMVSLCSPSEYHFHQAVTCLKAGVRLIWLEKPPVDSYTELQELQMCAKQCGATVLVSYQRRYCANFRAMRDLYVGGQLGEARSAQVFYSRGLECNGSHMLDILFFVSQDRGKVILEGVNAGGGSENPSFAFSTDGFPVHVTGLDLPYHCVELMVFFERGRASIQYSGLASRVDAVIENEYAPGYYRLSAGDTPVQLPPAEATCIFPFVAIDDLIGASEGRRSPCSSLESAAQTQRLVSLVRSRLK